MFWGLGGFWYLVDLYRLGTTEMCCCHHEHSRTSTVGMGGLERILGVFRIGFGRFKGVWCFLEGGRDLLDLYRWAQLSLRTPQNPAVDLGV